MFVDGGRGGAYVGQFVGPEGLACFGVGEINQAYGGQFLFAGIPELNADGVMTQGRRPQLGRLGVVLVLESGLLRAIAAGLYRLLQLQATLG